MKKKIKLEEVTPETEPAEKQWTHTDRIAIELDMSDLTYCYYAFRAHPKRMQLLQFVCWMRECEGNPWKPIHSWEPGKPGFENVPNLDWARNCAVAELGSRLKKLPLSEE